MRAVCERCGGESFTVTAYQNRITLACDNCGFTAVRPTVLPTGVHEEAAGTASAGPSQVATTYQYRDVESRKQYMARLMRERRAKARAARLTK